MSASYPPVLGGLQTVAQTLAQYLLAQKHQVQVIANLYPRSLPAQEIREGVSVRRWLFLTPKLSDLYRGRPDLFLASFYAYPVTLWRLSRLFQSFQPEVVNVHYPDGQIPFVLWLRRRFAFRLVVSLHGHDISSNPLRSLLQKADAVTACSRYLLDKAIELEPGVAVKGHAIHNGLDLIRFTDPIKYTHPRPYILAFGRLSYQKGFDLLLAAFAQVAQTFPQMDLILAGDGEDKPALQSQAQQLGLDDRLHLFGRATPSQVVQLLNGCEFVVAPSRWEPFGLVALEAMAAGKPVLATRVGGLPEFVPGSGNHLVTPTVEKLAEGLKEWLKHTEEIKALAAQNRVRAAAYTWDKMIEQYLEVYKSD